MKKTFRTEKKTFRNEKTIEELEKKKKKNFQN